MKIKDVDHQIIHLLAKEYLCRPYITFATVGNANNLSPRMVSDILWRGIAENILSSDDSNAIYAKAVRFSKRGMAQRAVRWDKAFDQRAIVREKIIKQTIKLKKLESIFVYWLDNYSQYENSSVSPIPIEALSSRLESIRKKLDYHLASLK